MQWQQLDECREFKVVDNVTVIRPINKLPTPVFCPVCSFPMKDSGDFMSFQTWQCCHRCELKFARTNPGWHSGDRPDKTTEQWREYTTDRLAMFRPAFRFV